MRLLICLLLLSFSQIIFANTLRRRSLSNILSPPHDERSTIVVRKLTLVNILSSRHEEERSSSDEDSTNCGSTTDDDGAEASTSAAEESAAAEDSAAAQSATESSARISSDDYVISTDGLLPTLGPAPFDVPTMTATMRGLGMETMMTGGSGCYECGGGGEYDYGKWK